MKTSLATSLAIAFVIVGCTTIPDRYVRDPVDPSSCGYRVEPTEKAGFALEVFYKEYKFLPSADQPVQGAKQCFLRTAERLAKQEGRTLKPIFLGDINAAPTRNTVDGTYSVFVTGRVQYLD